MLTATQRKCIALRNRLYPEEERPGVVHERAVSQSAVANGVLLELGCGREGKFLKRMSEHFGLCVGLDVEAAAQGRDGENWRLVMADVHHIPIQSNSVDTVATKNVAEHLADPTAVFAECRRVLKPGGRLIVLTVNQWFPPIVLARLLPHGVKQVLNKMASGTEEEDTFPTYYRANTANALAAAGRRAGLEPIDVSYISQHPHYLMFSVLAYRLGVAMERVVRRSEPLAFLRHMLGAVFTKPMTG